MIARVIFGVLAGICFVLATLAATVPTFWIFALLEPVRPYLVGAFLVLMFVCVVLARLAGQELDRG